MRKVRYEMYLVMDKFGGHPGEKSGQWWPFTDGLFHGWGLETDEHGSYTVALVERTDGTVVCILPEKLKFLDED